MNTLARLNKLSTHDFSAGNSYLSVFIYLFLCISLFIATQNTAKAENTPQEKVSVQVGDVVQPLVAAEFLILLQKAIIENDRDALASVVHYPVRINGSKKDGTAFRFSVKTKDQFLKHYEYIITKKVKQDILDQDPYEVFQNYQGFMVGSGSLWMRPYNGTPLIYAINR
ncbi:MAG: hypothetical protein HY795_06020 [Desulfovibrio sp.]|jgi:hypothetical protein|nr:hypothetical protein [Desulfovibrio sp.]MBI4961390.1 hypothetical protein [Desulfovibrio sp.]